eukprot:gene12718-17056_t
MWKLKHYGSNVMEKSFAEDVESLKKKANEHFVAQNFKEAVVIYSEAIEKINFTYLQDESIQNTGQSILDDKMDKSLSIKDVLAILYTNRAAAYLSLNLYRDAINDSNEALLSDKTYMKAYYRKSTALEQLGLFRESFEVWTIAAENCEYNSQFLKQYQLAKQKWKKIFLLPSNPIVSQSDLVSRFSLLKDKREKLSTMAHFWNDSNNLERFQYFELLISIIGGTGELSDSNRQIDSDMMMAMPLHNYEDLPRSRVSVWCDYFETLSSQEKAETFGSIWKHLSSEEQNDVIVDLRLFISQQIHPSPSIEVQEELTDSVS